MSVALLIDNENKPTLNLRFNNLVLDGSASFTSGGSIQGEKWFSGALGAVTPQTLTIANSNTLYAVNNTGGGVQTINLPAPSASTAGMKLRFYCAAAGAAHNTVINCGAGLLHVVAVVNGAIVTGNADQNVNFLVAADAVGDYAELTCDGLVWECFAFGLAAGSLSFT